MAAVPSVRRTLGALLSEVRVLAARPAVWALLGGMIGFFMLPRYLGVWAATALTGWGTQTARMAAMLTLAESPGTAALMVGGLGGGLLALALGALVAGSDHAWGCAAARALHTRGRAASSATRLCALGVVLLVCAAVAVAVTALMAALLPLPGLDVPTGPPSLAQVLAAVASGWLALAAWAACGALLATVARSAEVALTIGAVYALVVEQVLGSARGIALADALRGVSLSGLGFAAARSAHPVAAEQTFGPGAASLALAAVAMAFSAASVMIGARQDL